MLEPPRAYAPDCTCAERLVFRINNGWSGMSAGHENLTLVVGGAASGKSSYAETLVHHSGARRRFYLAPAVAFDTEMEQKTAAHRRVRGSGWTKIEDPTEIRPVIADLRPGDILLFDCATVWLSNLVLADRDLEEEQTALVRTLTKARAPVVIVSNEVGSGIVPQNPMARRFRDAHGRLNRRLAAEAALVVAVMAGLPLALKGGLPAIDR